MFAFAAHMHKENHESLLNVLAEFNPCQNILGEVPASKTMYIVLLVGISS